MDPFSISCTTCQVSLKVRDPSVIGQILTCPKCGSMVLVSQPETVNTEPGERTQAGIKDPRPPRATRPIPPELPRTAAASTNEAFDGGAEEWESGLDPDAIDEVYDQAVLPTDDWASAGARRWRGSLQLAVAAGVGLLLALGLLAIWATRPAEPPERAGAAAAPTPSTSEGVAPIPDVAAGQGPNEESNDDASPAGQPIPSQPVAEGTIPPELPPEAPAPLTARETAAIEPELAADVPSELESPKPEVPVADDEPPGFVPRDSSAESAADRMTNSNSLSRMLRNVESLLGDGETSEDVKPGEEEAPVAAPPKLVEGPAERELRRPMPRSIDVATRLEDSVQQIEYTDTPLIEVIRFASQLSTIPISVHPESLLWMQITPNTLVSARQADATVADVLQTALHPLGLDYELTGDQLLIRRPRSTDGKREVLLEVDDLTKRDPNQLSSLAKWIETVVAPGTWRGPGRVGSVEPEETSLRVSHEDDVLFESIVLCEKLRVARGLPTRSRYGPSLFALTPRAKSAQPTLQKLVTLTFLEPTPLTHIVRAIEQASQIRLLVDWQSLATERWNPDATRTLTVHDEPLLTALKRLLEPMNLSFRVVGPKVLQVSSRDVLAERQYVEFYLADHWLPAGVDVDIATRALEATLAEAELAAKFVIDPVSRTLIVLGNAATHRELRLSP